MEDAAKVIVIGLVAFLAIYLIFFVQSLDLDLDDAKVVMLEPAVKDANGSGTSSVSLKVPAVDDDGKGVSTTLIVEMQPGSGGTLVDVNQLLFWTDTQSSIRTAKAVAEQYANVDISNIDLTYRIETNASAIGGPSAGAAIVIATISVLQGKSMDPHVMITGTINPDGTIGQVGGIEEKAKAAKDAGATMFLVPEGQSVDISSAPSQVCRMYGLIRYCKTDYATIENDIGKTVGISVAEVSNVQEALKYFFA
jgi:uncharacterized protein